MPRGLFTFPAPLYQCLDLAVVCAALLSNKCGAWGESTANWACCAPPASTPLAGADRYLRHRHSVSPIDAKDLRSPASHCWTLEALHGAASGPAGARDGAANRHRHCACTIGRVASPHTVRAVKLSNETPVEWRTENAMAHAAVGVARSRSIARLCCTYPLKPVRRPTSHSVRQQCLQHLPRGWR